jgi:predicted tellurium resistance membrane protein TerC
MVDFDFGVLLTSAGLFSLFTLTLLEIILGVDNIIFISIITESLKGEQKRKARNVGLFIAMILRIILLFGIGLILKSQTENIDIMPQFVKDWFPVAHKGHVPYLLSIKELILLAGGLFLMYKSVTEIHAKVQGDEHQGSKTGTNSFTKVIIQSALINLIFSIDSILTAIGIVKEVPIMMGAVVLSMVVMFVFAGKIADFINKHPTIKMLALSFLVMIGFVLVCEAFNYEFPKALIYFAMLFSFLVEFFNIRMRKNMDKKQKNERSGH